MVMSLFWSNNRRLFVGLAYLCQFRLSVHPESVLLVYRVYEFLQYTNIVYSSVSIVYIYYTIYLSIVFWFIFNIVNL